MNRELYEFAELQPDVVEEIQKTEKRLSALTGFPVTLIAYAPEQSMDEQHISHL